MNKKISLSNNKFTKEHKSANNDSKTNKSYAIKGRNLETSDNKYSKSNSFHQNNNINNTATLINDSKIRVAKFIAQCGVCSRRDAEKMIFDNQVSVNGEVINNPAISVGLNDIVKVNGEVIAIKSSEIYLYHKPHGLVTTHSDEKNRETVFEHLPSHLPRLISVGRLDINSEGLLILTTDSKIAHYLELPKNKIHRTYQVRVFGKIDEKKLASIAEQGLNYEGIKYNPFKYKILTQTLNNSWIELTLYEGKNREIRNIMNFLDLKISRLLRIEYGQFALGDLEPGKVVKVSNIITNNILAEINENSDRNS